MNNRNYPADTYSAATLHEYTMVNKTLAKVTCSVAKDATREEIASAITEALNGAGTVVSGSFRRIDENTAVGFVAASREVRPIDSPLQIAKAYKVLSSNMYLDNNDKSLWELKEGASGRYLARNGVDNLESLIQASRVSPTGSIPRLNRIVNSSVSKHEIVAFVKQTNWTTEVDYGVCLASKDGSLTVVTEDGKEQVSASTVIASYVLEDAKPSMKASVYNEPINNIKDYYRLAYGGPDATPGDMSQQEYQEAVMQQIDELALA